MNCWFWRLLFCLFFVVVKVFVVIYVVEEEEAEGKKIFFRDLCFVNDFDDFAVVGDGFICVFFKFLSFLLLRRRRSKARRLVSRFGVVYFVHVWLLLLLRLMTARKADF